ncbi:hypothetical protein DdX_07525 [Ditylenchus destructor]|uniref:Uncharacterized protein n=1 Tax=Ditylenchus destructor TaxID=166010 RepID=A0AAD4N9Q7_9BILA|nr:hypothetical protein DdX_07525 [Ditylenchus destructor]
MVVGRGALFAKRRQSANTLGSNGFSTKKANPKKRNRRDEKQKVKPVYSAPVVGVTDESDSFTEYEANQTFNRQKRRPSIDFASAVLQAARRASEGRRLSSAFQMDDQESLVGHSITTDRGHISPTNDADDPCPSPFPSGRRRACDVAVNKTCAILQSKMKEANCSSIQ